MEGARLQVFLDGSTTPVIDFTDPNPLLNGGRVGVRTWNSDAAYRNLRFHPAGSPEVADSFSPAETPGGVQEVSGMWDAVRTGSVRGSMRLDRDRPFNTAQSQRIELISGPGALGVANRGLNRWGLTFRKAHRYQGRVYLRGAAGARVTVALESGDGSRTYASRKLGAVATEWKRFDFTLEPSETDTKGRFALWLDQPGTVWADQVYLSPTGEELFSPGSARADITKMLRAQGLTLLRYGGSMVNAPAYRWKQMVGDPDRRTQYLGTWYPQSTNGWATPEFAAFCRAAGFEAVIAINIDETDEDAADLVEFMNGPANTPWGRRRAELGYPEPFNVRYFEIGNEEGLGGSPEQYRSHYRHYLERFHALHRSMLRRDAELQLIIAAWWRPEDPVIRRIVEDLRDEAALWDLHVGGDGLRDGEEVDRLFTQMRRLVQEWAPGTKLKACVLEENGGLHNLRRALGHAAILNATQRHGDFVLMDCPANCLQPWQQNDNGWDQGQIFFTSSQVWGMPPFYAQQMAALNHLPERLSSEVVCANRELDLTATRSEDAKTIVLKVVNIGSRAHRTSVRIENGRPLSNRAQVTTLSGQLDGRNSPEQPERIRSVKSAFREAGREFDYTFAAYSYTVIRLRAR
jgi:alpha-L-arabinofuranosidase